MRKIYQYSLLIILFILSGCGCDNSIVEGSTDNYITHDSSVIIFADGCSDINGSTSNTEEGNTNNFFSAYVPTGQCDDYYGGSGSWSNRGRWIKVPGDASSVLNGDNLSVTVHGNIHYCSYGYDNKNPSPTITVKPAHPKETWFEYDPTLYSEGELPEPTQLPVQEGQLIVLEVSQSPTTGLALGEDAANLTAICADTDYDGFVNERCKAIKGFALTIYTVNGEDATEIVTLDNKDSNDSTYTTSKFRYPDLFKPFINQTVTVPETTAFEDLGGDTQNLPDAGEEISVSYRTALNNFDYWVKNKYGPSHISGIGPGKYAFKVPEGMNGVLGFSIAQEAGLAEDGTAGAGDGYYNINVRSSNPGCHVRDSIVSETGDRGAVQVLITNSNPNIEDTTTEFPENTTSIAEYYPELLKYIADKSGVTITSNANALSDLVVYSEYEQDLIVIDSQEYSGKAHSTGDLWLKVRDDYYHDNIGQYQVDVEVTTKIQTLVSDFLADVSDPIIESLDNTQKIIYDSFASDSRWINIMQMSLFLYITIYGAGFILGISQTSANDMVVRAIKIGVIVVLFKPDSWEFFNTYFFKLFTDGKDFLITAVTGDTSSDKSGVFGFVDDMFYTFFSEYTWEKLTAMTPYLIGFVYVCIFILVMVLYTVAMAKVFIVYLLTLVGIALLLSLAPMFMVVLLFEKTRKIFLNWVKYLADYAIQPVILFAALYVMNEIFMTFWNNALDITIRYGGVWNLNFFGVDGWTYGVIPAFDFGCVQYYCIDKANDNDNCSGPDCCGSFDMFDMLANVLILYVFVYTIQAIFAHIPTLTESLMKTSSASSTSGTANKIMQTAVNFAQGGDPVAKQKHRNRLEARESKEKEYSAKRAGSKDSAKNKNSDNKNTSSAEVTKT